MTSDAQQPNGQKISDDQRFSYIGFEVFPGKPKELFSSESEKQKLLDQVRSRRAKGLVIRDDAKLMEERVSGFEKLILTAACVIMVLSLFLPWYSIYNERVVEETVAAAEAAPAATQGEEIITSQQVRKKYIRDYQTSSGIGGLAYIGQVMGSGAGLMLTGIVYLVFTLLCLGIPVFILMTLYGAKGSPDEVAIQLKQRMRYAWLPVICFAAGMLFSFLGGSYGFSAQAFSSLGSSYGFLAYFGSLSWGVLVAMAASLLIALKGIEI